MIAAVNGTRELILVGGAFVCFFVATLVVMVVATTRRDRYQWSRTRRFMWRIGAVVGALLSLGTATLVGLWAAGADWSTGGTSTTASFCSTHDCIPNFDNGRGYIVQCNDGTYSHSGGIQGACSDHGREGLGP